MRHFPGWRFDRSLLFKVLGLFGVRVRWLFAAPLWVGLRYPVPGSYLAFLFRLVVSYFVRLGVPRVPLSYLSLLYTIVAIMSSLFDENMYTKIANNKPSVLRNMAIDVYI